MPQKQTRDKEQEARQKGGHLAPDTGHPAETLKHRTHKEAPLPPGRMDSRQVPASGHKKTSR